MDSYTYNVVLENKAKVESQLQAIAKRAVRKNLPVPTWTWGKVYIATEKHEVRHPEYSDMMVMREFKVDRIELTLTGEPIRYNGWEFVAGLTRLDDVAGNFIRVIPGKALPAQYRDCESHCDHCHCVRRRNETYVVQNTETGEYKQVGSSCLQDFLGGYAACDLAAQACCFADMALSAETGCVYDVYGDGGKRSVRALLEVLEVTAASIRIDGWVSRKSAKLSGSCATADKVWFEKTTEPTADDCQLAQTALAWAIEISDERLETDHSGYLHNIRLVARHGWVDSKMVGLGCSVIAAYQNEQARLLREKLQQEQRAISTYVGTIGKRETFRGTLVLVTGYETAYGYTTVLKFRTDEGNLLVWKASSNSDFLTKADIGKVFDILGTVKAHEEYKEEKQTIINRCKLTLTGKDISAKDTNPAKDTPAKKKTTASKSRYLSDNLWDYVE